MKRKMIQTIVALLSIASGATAQTLSVASVEATTGGQAELVVSGNDMDMYGVTALQFNLALPQGVTLNESAIAKGNAASGHTLSVQTMANGDCLIVLYQTDLGLIFNGTLLRLPIIVGQQAGNFSGSLYTVRTANTEAESHNCSAVGFSITVKAPVQPVTITADDKTMTYGDDVPALTYKSSGATLNGTPKLSTTATKASPAGTYSIKVEQGTVTNEQVTYVDGTLTIEKAALTVAAQDVTITEGDAIPAFTLTYSGWRNNDSEAMAFTKKPKATTLATSASKPGTYPIIVSGGEAENYMLTYTRGTLTIKAKPVEPVTITADDKTMTYGDDVPALTYKSNGATLNGTPKLSTTATKASPAGTYSIKVEQGTVTNEQVTYVDGTLTILQNTNDLTSRVGTAAADWQAVGLIDWAGPKIITRDGRETALAEVYETTTGNTGTVMEQTVTGLKDGAYEVTVYANGFYTDGRGFDSNITDGQKDVAFVFANEAKTYIVAHIGTSVSTHGEYTLNCNVTNGKLHMGLTAEKAGTNWHSIQIKSLERIGEVNGIRHLAAEPSQDNRVYNLGGQRLSNPQKGINIVGGKKVFVP